MTERQRTSPDAEPSLEQKKDPVFLQYSEELRDGLDIPDSEPFLPYLEKIATNIPPIENPDAMNPVRFNDLLTRRRSLLFKLDALDQHLNDVVTLKVQLKREAGEAAKKAILRSMAQYLDDLSVYTQMLSDIDPVTEPLPPYLNEYLSGSEKMEKSVALNQVVLPWQYDVVRDRAGFSEKSPIKMADQVTEIMNGAAKRRVRMQSIYDCLEEASNADTPAEVAQVKPIERLLILSGIDRPAPDAVWPESELQAAKVFVHYMDKHDEKIEQFATLAGVPKENMTVADALECCLSVNVMGKIASKLGEKAEQIWNDQEIPDMKQFVEDLFNDGGLYPDRMVEIALTPLANLSEDASPAKRETVRSDAKRVGKELLGFDAQRTKLRRISMEEGAKAPFPGEFSEGEIQMMQELRRKVQSPEMKKEILRACDVPDNVARDGQTLESRVLLTLEPILQEGDMTIREAFELYYFAEVESGGSLPLLMKVSSILARKDPDVADELQKKKLRQLHDLMRADPEKIEETLDRMSLSESQKVEVRNLGLYLNERFRQGYEAAERELKNTVKYFPGYSALLLTGQLIGIAGVVGVATAGAIAVRRKFKMGPFVRFAQMTDQEVIDLANAKGLPPARLAAFHEAVGTMVDQYKNLGIRYHLLEGGRRIGDMDAVMRVATVDEGVAMVTAMRRQYPKPSDIVRFVSQFETDPERIAQWMSGAGFSQTDIERGFSEFTSSDDLLSLRSSNTDAVRLAVARQQGLEQFRSRFRALSEELTALEDRLAVAKASAGTDSLETVADVQKDIMTFRQQRIAPFQSEFNDFCRNLDFEEARRELSLLLFTNEAPLVHSDEFWSLLQKAHAITEGTDEQILNAKWAVFKEAKAAGTIDANELAAGRRAIRLGIAGTKPLGVVAGPRMGRIPGRDVRSGGFHEGRSSPRASQRPQTVPRSTEHTRSVTALRELGDAGDELRIVLGGVDVADEDILRITGMYGEWVSRFPSYANSADFQKALAVVAVRGETFMRHLGVAENLSPDVAFRAMTGYAELLTEFQGDDAVKALLQHDEFIRGFTNNGNSRLFQALIRGSTSTASSKGLQEGLRRFQSISSKYGLAVRGGRFVLKSLAIAGPFLEAAGATMDIMEIYDITSRIEQLESMGLDPTKDIAICHMKDVRMYRGIRAGTAGVAVVGTGGALLCGVSLATAGSFTLLLSPVYLGLAYQDSSAYGDIEKWLTKKENQQYLDQYYERIMGQSKFEGATGTEWHNFADYVDRLTKLPAGIGYALGVHDDYSDTPLGLWEERARQDEESRVAYVQSMIRQYVPGAAIDPSREARALNILRLRLSQKAGDPEAGEHLIISEFEESDFVQFLRTVSLMFGEMDDFEIYETYSPDHPLRKMQDSRPTFLAQAYPDFEGTFSSLSNGKTRTLGPSIGAPEETEYSYVRFFEESDEETFQAVSDSVEREARKAERYNFLQSYLSLNPDAGPYSFVEMEQWGIERLPDGGNTSWDSERFRERFQKEVQPMLMMSIEFRNIPTESGMRALAARWSESVDASGRTLLDRFADMQTHREFYERYAAWRGVTIDLPYPEPRIPLLREWKEDRFPTLLVPQMYQDVLTKRAQAIQMTSRVRGSQHFDLGSLPRMREAQSARKASMQRIQSAMKSVGKEEDYRSTEWIAVPSVAPGRVQGSFVPLLPGMDDSIENQRAYTLEEYEQMRNAFARVPEYKRNLELRRLERGNVFSLNREDDRPRDFLSLIDATSYPAPVFPRGAKVSHLDTPGVPSLQDHRIAVTPADIRRGILDTFRSQYDAFNPLREHILSDDIVVVFPEVAPTDRRSLDVQTPNISVDPEAIDPLTGSLPQALETRF